MPIRLLGHWRDGSDEVIEALFRHVPVMMHSIDADGVLIDVSDFWAEQLGYAPGEMIGRPCTDFLADESRRRAEEKMLPSFYRTGRIISVPYDFVRKSGERLPVLLSAVSRQDSDGRFERSLAIIFDNSEARRMQAMLARSQRLEAVGRLVGGVAHDFNNLLSIIQGNLEFLRDDPDDLDRASFVDDALRAARRGASLTQQLLAYGRRSRLAPQEVDLGGVAEGYEAMLRRLLPESIVISSWSAPALWPVRVDPEQLDAALLNLVNNARDALSGGGAIRIVTENLDLDEPRTFGDGESLPAGRYVTISVSDDGDGIPLDVLPRVFEPFFTTKEVGRGSGLGLSMVQGFTRQSGGAAQVESIPGFGATVTLCFPACASAQTAASGSRPEGREAAQKVQVLVVEDEPDVRRVVTIQLARAGHEVAEAASGDEALAMLENGLRPQLLVTDVVMPGALQGPALAAAARQRDPGLPVVFLTGHDRHAAFAGASEATRGIRLTKPVRRDALLRAAEDALASGEAGIAFDAGSGRSGATVDALSTDREKTHEQAAGCRNGG